FPNLEVSGGDVREADFCQGQFDLILTERVIINVLERWQQYQAVGNIAQKLRPGGRYIMIESFKEPLQELNRGRKEMCLDPVEESYQNRYIDERFIFKIQQNFGLKEINGNLPSNYLSTHFYITRVFHKAVRPEGGKVKFSRFASFFD